MHPNLLNSVEALQSSDSILHLLNCINYIVLYFILYIIVFMSHILVYSSEIKIHSFIHSPSQCPHALSTTWPKLCSVSVNCSSANCQMTTSCVLY